LPTRTDSPHYRLLQEDDLPEAWHLLTVGLNAVRAAVNRPPVPQSEATLLLLRHLLAHDPQGAWGVEVAGRLEGFCLATLRQQQWFLSHYWIRDERQNRGLGWPLLQRVWDYGRRRGATLFATHASPNTTAHALYMRIGMDPIRPVYRLEGDADAAARFVEQQTAGQLRQRPFDAGTLEAAAPELDRLDRATRGAARLVDHRFWLESAGARAALAHRRGEEGEAVGYWYAFGGEGLLGPVVALEPGFLPQLLAQAMQATLSETSRFYLWMPAPTIEAIRALLQAGFRLAFFNVLFSSAAFPRPASYIPSGPDLW